MRILIAGASGFLGTRLREFLMQNHHEVHTLVRREPKNSLEIPFDPDKTLQCDQEYDALINLCGENIANGFWSEKRKSVLLSSRIKPTSSLCRWILAHKKPPAIFLNASATGFYADQKEKELDEESEAGEGFLGELAKKWESEARKVEAKTAVCLLRFGMILDPRGGALKKMLPAFSLGLGCALGGKQYMPWISLDDCVKAILHILDLKIFGPVNLVSPHCVTNQEFSKSLAFSLNRWLLPPVPAFLVRMTGEMSKELLLASCRVRPKKLLESGFEFQDPDLPGYLNRIFNYSGT